MMINSNVSPKLTIDKKTNGKKFLAFAVKVMLNLSKNLQRCVMGSLGVK